MPYKNFTFFLCLSSLLTLQGMNEHNQLVQNGAQQYVNLPKTVFASKDFLHESFSIDYKKFLEVLEILRDKKKDGSEGISKLTDLAKEGDIPSKYLLAWHYENKKVNKLSRSNKINLNNKKIQAQRWFSDTLISGYPLSQYDYGKKLLERDIYSNQGLCFIKLAASGKILEFQPCKIQYPPYQINIPVIYYHLEAIEFLIQYYREVNPSAERYWIQFKNYLKWLSNNK